MIIESQARNISMDDVAFLTAIPSPKSHHVLDELQHELWGRSCYKGISAHALERDEERRINHIVEVALDLKMLKFGDEAAKDERTVDSRPMFENWNKSPIEVFLGSGIQKDLLRTFLRRKFNFFPDAYPQYLNRPFEIGTPTECEPLSISWTGGQAPFEILLAPNISVPASAFSNGEGSYSIPQLMLSSTTSFVLTMSDATGFGSGGTTNELTVGNSAANNDCGAADPKPPYTFDLSPLTQCGQFTLTVNGGVVPPITVVQLIPGGESVVSNSDGDTFSSTLDVSAGTNLLYLVYDSLGNQGGVSPYEVVSGSSDSSCLSANSPSSTPNTPVTITATATAAASPPSSSSSPSSNPSSNNVAIIAGAAGGGGAVLVALVILGICLRRKWKASRMSDVRSSTKSHPRQLQHTDPSYKASPHPPQSPSPYKTNTPSNRTQPIHPGLGTQSEMTNWSTSSFAVSAPPSSFNQKQHSRQNSNTDSSAHGDTGSSTASLANSRQSPPSTRNFTLNDPRTPFNQTLHSRQTSATSSVDRRMASVAELPSPWEADPVNYLGPSIQPGSQQSPINASATNMATRDHYAPFNQTQPSHMSPNTEFAVYGDAQISDTTPVEHMAAGARPASPLPRKTDPVYFAPPVQVVSQSTSTSAGNVAVKNPPAPSNKAQSSGQSPSTDRLDVHGASESLSVPAQIAYQPPTRIIVHTDANDVTPDKNGVVELPPQYSEHWEMRVH
ncbi:uncharacterized protein F5147DRAFT_809225 [Suillus discolor]|uniref:Uncharacterized protein n=1 Tax=Suillus discolor TaxID=1912936 RepID=A0A9P7F333_9AGAM|nr:uncharacterized protein F5147DRAFT_809225 [Suillus discolor]KAG2103474.1 hypothetical protein F5147DRAFT_809225 [Suillus discolor]